MTNKTQTNNTIILPPPFRGEGRGGRLVLLHCCCAPCSSAILEWMEQNDVVPVIYYCNPNIYPEEEYLIRKNEITKYAEKKGIQIIDDDYDHQMWHDFIDKRLSAQGIDLAKQPERGCRCLECFKLRLLRSAKKCKELGLEFFTTTLASSRWKSLNQINEAGQWAAEQVNNDDLDQNLSSPTTPLSSSTTPLSPLSSDLSSKPKVTFWDKNWRKGGLQERRNQLLKENQFYNQLYCGCEYSMERLCMV